MAANLINQISTANTFQHWLGATTTLIGTVNLLTDGNGQSFFANTRLIIGGTAANVSLNVETGATINVLTSEIANTINLEAREVVFTGNLTSKTELSMNTGTGTFQTGEIVFQGPDNTVANANVTAIVYNWNTTSNVLSIIRVSGEFIEDANTYGANSTANWKTINTASGFAFSFPNIAIPSNVNVERDLFVDGNTRITGDLIVSGNITLDTIGFDDLDVAGSGTFGNTLSVTGVTTLSDIEISGTSNTTGNATFVHAEVTGTLTAEFLAGNANTQIQTSLAAVEASALAFSIALG